MAASIIGSETDAIPSEKNKAYENFPVGSWLLPARLRPHVDAFYAFARTIDDIADSPNLTPEDKVARLSGFAETLERTRPDAPAYAKAIHMRHSLEATGLSSRHCLDLICAFKQDAVKSRYDDWDDLLGYCSVSAAPVGRYLLDLHGGSRDGYGPSDALCSALQVINHLQDCQDDYLTLDRVYLPMSWMKQAGATVMDLGKTAVTPALKEVLNRMLQGADILMIEARTLPTGLESRRLAMESAAIVKIAERLIGRLRRQDPLAGRVALGKTGYAWCITKGIASALV